MSNVRQEEGQFSCDVKSHVFDFKSDVVGEEKCFRDGIGMIRKV